MAIPREFLDLDGTDGPDTLTGTSGADTLDGGPGADRMEGLAGNDLYFVGSGGDLVIEEAGGGRDRVSIESVSYLLPHYVEDASFAANLVVTGNGLGNAMAGADFQQRMRGGAGSDTLIGLAGDDRLDGGAGADVLAGGTGRDMYFVDSANDVVMEAGSLDCPLGSFTFAGGGLDEVHSNITYKLPGGVEMLFLGDSHAPWTDAFPEGPDKAIDGTGNALDNLLVGNDAANVLKGVGGVDTLAGGKGDDAYFLDDPDDVIVETGSRTIDLVGETVAFTGGGVDTLHVAFNATLPSQFEHLVLGLGAANGTGNASGNAVTGNGAQNVLRGLGGNDALSGLGGGDRLEGGAGQDTLTGGAGADAFQFKSDPVAANADLVKDFATGADHIDLDDAKFTAIGATGPFADLDARFAHGDGMSSAPTAATRLFYDDASGKLYYDGDGSGGLQDAVLVATLQGSPALVAADIRVI